MVLNRCIRKRSLGFPLLYASQVRKVQTSLCTMNISSYHMQYTQHSTSDVTLDRARLYAVTPFRKQSTYTKVNEMDNGVWLKMCLSVNDVKNYELTAPVDPILSYHKYKKSNCTLIDVKKTAYELFDEVENLEYYDAEQQVWLPIGEISNNETLSAKYKGRVLHLRIPAYYDSFVVGDIHDDSNFKGLYDIDHDDYTFDRLSFSDDDDDDDHKKKNDLMKDQKNDDVTMLRNIDRTSPEYFMEQLVRGLMKQLKESGYARSTIKPMTLFNARNNEEIFTKEWVQRECNTSTKLRSTILGRANAFHHIVQCLHYDFLWNDEE